jgi:DNA-binding NarL/FixJ family response regulator
VLVVEDDEQVGPWLARLIQLDGFDVRWARSVSEASGHLDGQLDVVILDWHLGSETGAVVIEKLRRQRLPAGVVVVTADPSDAPLEFVEESGEVGLLRKPARAADLREGCRAAAGLAAFRRRTVFTALARPRDRRDHESRDRGEHLLYLLESHLDDIGVRPLTDREREIVDLHFRGATRSEDVARVLGIAASTVRSHRKAICDKVGADSMQDLIRVITAHLSQKSRPKGNR